MSSEGRPLGVTALSLIAFAASPSLAILAIWAIWELLIVGGKDVPVLVSIVALILFDTGTLLLSWISYTAGCDLWRLRPRGLKLTIVSATIVFLYGVWLYFIAGVLGRIPAQNDLRLFGKTICFAASICLIYTFLPGVKAKFKTNVAPAS